MSAVRGTVLVLVVSGLMLALPVSAAFGGIVLADDADESDEFDEPGMAHAVSTFMQASAADANESVEAELFITAYENADDDTRQELVIERSNELEEKLESLRSEREELQERKDDMTETAYHARMTKLTVQIDSFERAVNETTDRAAAVGVDTAGLEQLRTEAANLSGPKVAEIAQGIAGIDPPRGPPDDVPGQGADITTPEDAGNQTSPGQSDGNSVGQDGNHSAGQDGNHSAGQNGDHSAGQNGDQSDGGEFGDESPGSGGDQAPGQTDEDSEATDSMSTPVQTVIE